VQPGPTDEAQFELLVRRHRVTPMVADGLGDTEGPWRAVADRLRTAADQIDARNEEFLADAVRIADAADAAGVPIVVRKGIPLAVSLYGRIGSREMDDIDLLVRRRDAGPLREVLEALGFAYGRSAHGGAGHRPWDRQTEIGWAANGLELPGYTRPGRQGSIRVSLVAAIFDRRADESVDIEGVFTRTKRQELAGCQLPVMSGPDCLLDLCAHFTMDAKSTAQIAQGADLLLHRFCDVGQQARRLQAEGSWEKWLDLVATEQAEPPMWYALECVEQVYGEVIPRSSFESLAPRDPEYLHRYGDLEGELRRWANPSVRDRVFGREVDQVEQLAGRGPG
jgi:hypothetical protein